MTFPAHITLQNLNYYQNVYYNTVKVRAQRPFYANSGNQNLTIKNNIFSTESSSYPAFYCYNGVSGLLVSDYNDLHTSYTYPVYYYYGYKTFDQWQSDGYDSNSVMIDPVFNNDSTLVPLALALDNRGTPLTSITDDINDVIRSTSTPDLGAQEFSVSSTPLSETYTVGSGGDFTTLDSLRLSLMAYGISGPVTINFLSGTYTDIMSLGPIPGTSATNTVTFQSATGNADDVSWVNNVNSVTENYILQLAGTDHLKIKHITFQSTNQSYSRKVVLSGVIDSLSIDSCKFIGFQASHNTHVSIYGDPVEATGLMINGNTFTDGGYAAIYLNSNNYSSSPTGLVVTNNSFTDTYGGVFVKYYDAVTMRGNSFQGTNMHDKGIYLDYCDGANIIEDNHMVADEMNYGIYLSYCQSTAGNEAIIANNLINVDDYGIYMLYNNYFQNFLFT